LLGRSLRVRFLTSIAVLLCALPLSHGAHGAALERGLAVTDPLALRELDLSERRADGLADSGFDIGRILGAATTGDGPLYNDALFALPSMVLVRRAIDDEFDRYIARHRVELPRETIGVGDTFCF
jgi:hypothetical protein